MLLFRTGSELKPRDAKDAQGNQAHQEYFGYAVFLEREHSVHCASQLLSTACRVVLAVMVELCDARTILVFMWYSTPAVHRVPGHSI